MSKEHVTSKGILDSLAISSLTYTGNGESGIHRSMGVNALTLPILCRYHNSALSDIDAEAVHWYSGVSRLVSEPIGSTGLEDRTGRAVLEIDGFKLERWAAKTFLNAILSGLTLAPEERPYLSVASGQIVDQVFGGEAFPDGQGLYALPLGSNLFNDPGFPRRPLQITIISKDDVEHWSNRTKGWSGPFRLPALLYMNAYGFELLMYANITGLDNATWAKITKDYWAHKGLGKAARPRQVKFDIPQLDGDRGSQPNRTIRFIWQRQPER